MQAESSGGGRALVKTSTPGIYRRGKKYVVRVRDARGKQVQRSAKTLKEAKGRRAELTADILRGDYRPGTKVTFAAYADQWCETYTGRTTKGIKPETLKEYRVHLERAVKAFGPRLLAAITHPDVKAYVKSIADKGLSPSSQRRFLVPLRAMFATALEDGLIRSNPAAGIRVIRPAEHDADAEDQASVKALAPEQLAALVAAVQEGWRQTLVRTLAQTGLRLGEALGLRWKDVDLQAGRVHVRQRVRNGTVGRPKSKDSTRQVPIGRGLVRDLRAHRLASPWSADNDLVFPTATGRPHSSTNLYRWYKPAAERAGVAWAGFHTLRHTAASRWLLSGISIPQVSRLLGHADPGFTMRTYIHVLPEDLPAGDALAGAVGMD